MTTAAQKIGGERLEELGYHGVVEEEKHYQKKSNKNGF